MKTERQVNIEVSEEDRLTANLARVLLVAEIASQVLACFVVLEMVEHGQLRYLLRWHAERFFRKFHVERERSREWQRSLGRMLFEAERIVRETQHG